jgi:hypothetical protein
MGVAITHRLRPGDFKGDDPGLASGDHQDAEDRVDLAPAPPPDRTSLVTILVMRKVTGIAKEHPHHWPQREIVPAERDLHP